MTCPEFESLVQRAIRVGESAPPTDEYLVTTVALCIRGLRSLAAASGDQRVQNDVGVGLGRIVFDDDRLLNSEFGQAIDKVLACIWPDA